MCGPRAFGRCNELALASSSAAASFRLVQPRVGPVHRGDLARRAAAGRILRSLLLAAATRWFALTTPGRLREDPLPPSAVRQVPRVATRSAL